MKSPKLPSFEDFRKALQTAVNEVDDKNPLINSFKKHLCFNQQLHTKSNGEF